MHQTTPPKFVNPLAARARIVDPAKRRQPGSTYAPAIGRGTRTTRCTLADCDKGRGGRGWRHSGRTVRIGYEMGLGATPSVVAPPPQRLTPSSRPASPEPNLTRCSRRGGDDDASATCIRYSGDMATRPEAIQVPPPRPRENILRDIIAVRVGQSRRTRGAGVWRHTV